MVLVITRWQILTDITKAVHHIHGFTCFVCNIQRTPLNLISL